MADREKVIKGLETCTMTTRANRCLKCPYAKEERDTTKWCTRGLHRDILALLKAQEPKTVKEMLVVGGHLMGKCPRCCKILTVQDHPIACGFCGQAVKWDK